MNDHSNAKDIKVLHVATEMAPIEKHSALGDVLGALPRFLRAAGVDARVLLPLYRDALTRCQSLGIHVQSIQKQVHVALNYRVYSASIYEAEYKGVPIYLLEQHELFTSPNIYEDALTPTRAIPFVFLSFAALELANAIGWQPNIFHVHDWSVALLPVALRWHHHYHSMSKNYDTVLTIHNLSHQGIVENDDLGDWGFKKKAESLSDLDFYGQCNLLKGGILTSDAITTVSPHYSWDIQTIDEGFGLHSVLSENKAKLHGILNGVDYDAWNPSTDPFIGSHFSIEDLRGKRICKEELLKICDWPDDGKPILAFVGRLAEQKGVDILLSALDWVLVGNCRMVLLGTGQEHYKNLVEIFAEKYSDYFYACTEYDEKLSHKIYAGSDILLMPSLFEPCGQSQIIAMSYGTVPVVRATGGLADTVIDFDTSSDGTGFLFSEYSAAELADAISRAVSVYSDPSKWSLVMKNSMQANFSWSTSAKMYKELYVALQKGDNSNNWR